MLNDLHYNNQINVLKHTPVRNTVRVAYYEPAEAEQSFIMN